MNILSAHIKNNTYINRTQTKSDNITEFAGQLRCKADLSAKLS